MPDYARLLEGLEENERIYVESRLKGMSRNAANRAAGTSKGGNDIESRPHIQELFRKAHAMSAREVGMTREKVGEMLLEAYRNSANAAEQIMAAREIGKLYGLYAAEKVEINHKVEQIAAQGDLKQLTNEELAQLAQMDRSLVLEGEFVELPDRLALPVPASDG